MDDMVLALSGDEGVTVLAPAGLPGDVRRWDHAVAAWARDPDTALARLRERIAGARDVPLGEPRIACSDQHSNYFVQRPIYLAEQRMLRLGTPNPMPSVDLFPRLSRLAARWSRRRG